MNNLEESYNVRDKAVAFICDILQKRYNSLSVHVSDLIVHFQQAPKDIKDCVSSLSALKKLIRDYDEHLAFSKSHVYLVKKLGNESKIMNHSVDAVNFYRAVLMNESRYFFIPIHSLLMSSRLTASEEVKREARTKSQLKVFLLRYPHIFTVIGNNVALSEQMKTINKCVTYYQDLLRKVIKTVDEPVSIDLLFYLGETIPSLTPPVVKLAIKNSDDLRKMCSVFGTIFVIVGQQIGLKYPQRTIDINQLVSTNSTNENPGDNRSHCDNFVKSSPRPTNELSPMNNVTNNLEKLNLNVESSQEEAINSAVEFFSKKLWEYGPCKIVNINELFKCRDEAPDNCTKLCGNNYNEFKDFLKRHSDHFIVTSEHVMIRRNAPRKKWSPPYKQIEEPVSSLLLNFFKNLINDHKPQKLSSVFLQVGKCFTSDNGEQLFKTCKDLENFLNMFPEIFFINNDSVVNIMHCEKEKVNRACQVAKKIADKNLLLDVSAGGLGVAKSLEKTTPECKKVEVSEKDTILSKIKYITEIDKCKAVVEEILTSDKVISLDCEGLNLGAAGTVSLIQICRENGEVYIFDILENGELIDSGKLKCLLESDSIIKVIHDCRNDSANLYYQCNVVLKKVFDTTVAHSIIIKKSKGKSPNIGFNDLCRTYGAPINNEKDNLKYIYKDDPQFWGRRPITKEMFTYAALDVACLVPHVFNAIREKLGELEHQVYQFSAQLVKTSYLC